MTNGATNDIHTNNTRPGIFDDKLHCFNNNNDNNNNNNNDNNNNNNNDNLRNHDDFTRGFFESNESSRSDIDILNDNLNVNIYRYKFTEEFTEELYKFSKVHQYDHRKDFKEAWIKWTDDNNLIVLDEINRLTKLGYNGDILDKMFKSARYYFRNKSTEKNKPQTRRTYIGSQKELLDAMDTHILNNINKNDYKPSNAFHDFCQENLQILQEEVTRLCKCGITDKNEIQSKVKKTYKNRYFMLVKRHLVQMA
jgi:hypothetical protein